VDLARFWDPEPQSCRRQQSKGAEIIAQDERAVSLINLEMIHNFFKKK
jgi:hypothetical protein